MPRDPFYDEIPNDDGTIRWELQQPVRAADCYVSGEVAESEVSQVEYEEPVADNSTHAPGLMEYVREIENRHAEQSAIHGEPRAWFPTTNIEEPHLMQNVEVPHGDLPTIGFMGSTMSQALSDSLANDFAKLKDIPTTSSSNLEMEDKIRHLERKLDIVSQNLENADDLLKRAAVIAHNIPNSKWTIDYEIFMDKRFNQSNKIDDLAPPTEVPRSSRRSGRSRSIISGIDSVTYRTNPSAAQF